MKIPKYVKELVKNIEKYVLENAKMFRISKSADNAYAMGYSHELVTSPIFNLMQLTLPASDREHERNS